MPRIAICDDNDTDAAYVRTLVERWAAVRAVEAAVETFPSAERFLTRYEEHQDFDILLLDVEMGAMDGVELAKAVRRNSKTVQIVFITGYSDYIAEGYDVEALHYLMKPVDERKLFDVLDRAVVKLRQNARCLNLQCAEGLVRIPLYDIRYLDVRQNYVTVHASRDYTVRRSLSEFENELSPEFFRAGRGLIVNLKQIRRVTKRDVLLADGTSLPLPRGAYEPLNRAIIERT
ncbi:LytR/AlgR family response regulator transcription factor [Bifidobacterium biavatii]|uniref:DNA-binding protein n=1 Tax=Bifidobacterium biavatii DSM 23969 TaxID=1437608 RepID=A0A086ZWQ7_9BIFI|nr:LytTR family DNA-binding domain-containing protein [Bifidobacterium biavatii]KFI50957.1 DNA-binding protein [Bifidobacterium biavatii DSM 23969]